MSHYDYRSLYYVNVLYPTNECHPFSLQSVLVKQNLTLQAVVTGKPVPEVKWYKYVVARYMTSILLCLCTARIGPL